MFRAVLWLGYGNSGTLIATYHSERRSRARDQKPTTDQTNVLASGGGGGGGGRSKPN
jgi:hypothetical protein